MSTNNSSNTNQVSAKRIAQLLYEKGWNKAELARQLGLSTQAVQHWAKGNSRPSGNNLTKLAEVSGKPEYWFFTSEDKSDSSETSSVESNEFAVLNEEQKELLRLFAKFTPSERRNMLAVFEMRLRELEDYFNKYVKGLPKE